jgi:serine/threonine protein phosphatase 1
MGNHEDLLLRALDDPENLPLWLMNGGKATLQSFNAHQPADIVSNYLPFFSTLEYYKSLDDYLLVHAGFDFSGSDPFTDYESMLWTRHFEPDEKYTQGRRIVHGHTPTRADHIIFSTKPPQATVINIDGGCVFGNGFRALGKLVALNLDTLEPVMVDYRG